MVWLPRGWGHNPAAHDHDHHHHPHHHGHWFLPHVRRLPQPAAGPVEVRKVDAVAQIGGQKAQTTLTIEFHNPDPNRPQEGQILLPVPHGAVLNSFQLEGSSAKYKAEILPREEARRIYDSIVSQMKDPAILEFAGMGAVKSGVFPVPANGVARIRLTYEELLPADGKRIDYVLPRSESLDYRVQWSLKVRWAVKEGVATVYSPSHQIKSINRGKQIEVEPLQPFEPGSFSLSVLREGKEREMATSFLSHPDEKGNGGWFLLLMTPPKPPKGAPKLKREVTVVLDRSGSMAGEKLDQARAAALQVIEGLEEDESFNLIVYNESVAKFAAHPMVATRKNVLLARDFINGIRVSGGTNIHGALSAAVQQPAKKGHIPIVLFLTDGLPTIGETSEKRIREEISSKNKMKRRIFTFGVGVDVNTPLLSRLADDSRATATYVLPKERVEVKVAKVFRRLSGPVVGTPEITAVDAKGNPIPGRVDDLIPNRLPDFFSGDQIVLTGRYHGKQKLIFKLTGDLGGKPWTYRLDFKPKKDRHPFVPRLWATRKIAILTEHLRDLGADSSMWGLTGGHVDRNDPRVKELVDEIVRLSTEYGILTEYTAFLARDGEVFNPVARQNEIARDNFVTRALNDRSGAKGVNQDANIWVQKGAACANPHNKFLNSKLQEEQVQSVQQAGDKAYYKQGENWVDWGVVQNNDVPAEEVELGSEEFKTLVDRLVETRRQSCLALGSKLEIELDGKRYRIK